MEVAVKELVGNEIPERFRSTGLKRVWVVMRAGEIFRFCETEEEAWILKRSLDQEDEPPPPPLASKPQKKLKP